MKQVLDLTHIDLFEVKLEFDINSSSIDLHNDYECDEIVISSKQVDFFFLNTTKKDSKVKISFLNSRIVSSKFDLAQKRKQVILQNFQRCKGIEAKKLVECTKDGEFFYIIEFDEGQLIEITSNKVTLYIL
jgi:hypothetical protein